MGRTSLSQKAELEDDLVVLVDEADNRSARVDMGKVRVEQALHPERFCILVSLC